MNKGPALRFVDPEVVILEKTFSTSGKYMLFLGSHYEAGHACWVVGTVSGITQIVTKRHYNSTIPGCLAPEAMAKSFWEEFRTLMKEKAHDEEPGYLDELQPYLQRSN